MNQQLPAGLKLVDSQERQPSIGTGVPSGLTLMTPAAPLENNPVEIQGQKGVFESFSDWVKGKNRMTRDIKNTPSIVDSGFLEGANLADVSRLAAMTMVTNDPNELANIFQKVMPDMRVQYNKDAEGNIYPILHNPNNGKTAIIDKPGMDIMNLMQFGGQAGLFSMGGTPGGVIKTAAVEGAKEGAIQTAQASQGGSFNVGDVATSAALGGSFEGLAKGMGFTYRSIKGDTSQEKILSASTSFNVPVLTSDIYNPKNWFQRGAQITSEWLPVVGTGGLRHSQQEAREQATEDFLSMYRGGTYEEVVQSVADKNYQLRQAANVVYNRVNPYLDQLSADGVPMENAKGEIDSLISYLSTPGLDIDESVLSMADDLDMLISGTPQSFQVLKDNVSAWHEKINSIDPNTRALPSKVKARFSKVLNAARKDRDTFAQNNLSQDDFNSLKEADAAWGDMVQEMSTTKLKAILEKGEATPEVVRNMMFSRNKSDIVRLYDSLTPKGQSSARAAFITQIASDLSKQQKGLTPTSLATQLNKYQDGVDVLFKGQEREALDGFITLMNATRRAQEVERGAGSQTFERLGGVGALTAGTAGLYGAIPLEAFAAYAGIGGVSRLMESPKVRNILVRANSVKPGSDAAQQLAMEFNKLLLASMQANPLKGTTDFEKALSEEFGSQKSEQK